MSNAMKYPGSFRVEVSGWGLDDSFFVEKTDLVWSQSGEKKVLLHHALPDGAIIFVRLQDVESAGSPCPVIYQVSAAGAMDCNGMCQMRLKQLNPRLKAPQACEVASNLQEDSQSACEPRESSAQLEPEEILQ